MKKIFSICLSLFFLLQSMNIHASDLIHVGDLIKHAQLHEKEYNDDWFSFLSKHYGSSKIEHEHDEKSDERDHEELPFTDHICSASSSVFFISPENLFPIKPNVLNKGITTFLYRSLYSFENSTEFFQPPKLV